MGITARQMVLQTDDLELFQASEEIKKRAIRRLGELLQSIPPGTGKKSGEEQEGA